MKYLGIFDNHIRRINVMLDDDIEHLSSISSEIRTEE
jgi:hypothetical protein